MRRNGKAYAPHLDGFIVALREELDCKLSNRNPPGIERKPYRLDVRSDGTGIESAGWFRTGIENGDSDDSDHSDDALMMSRLCALQWIVVLYDSVVPNTLMSEVRKYITTNEISMHTLLILCSLSIMLIFLSSMPENLSPLFFTSL